MSEPDHSLLSMAGKAVLITGGSHGIGEGCARGFVAAGAAVVIGDRDAPAGEALAAESFPFASVARYLVQAVDRIGPAKIMWGTDLPSLFAHATYRQLLDFARRPLAGLPPADLDLILGGNAQSVYGL